MEKLISKYMVRSPFLVEPGATVSEGLELMTDLEVRHLPVTENGELVGLVSERDLRESYAKDPGTLIKNVMVTNVYSVLGSTPLSEVLGTMIDKKLGSALVVSAENEVRGIFTTIDVLGILLETIEEEDDEVMLDDYFEDWAPRPEL